MQGTAKVEVLFFPKIFNVSTDIAHVLNTYILNIYIKSKVNLLVVYIIMGTLDYPNVPTTHFSFKVLRDFLTKKRLHIHVQFYSEKYSATFVEMFFEYVKVSRRRSSHSR